MHNNKQSTPPATPLPPGCKLVELRRGRGPRATWVYAEVESADGKILITGTLEYCVRRMVESLPAESTPTT